MECSGRRSVNDGHGDLVDGERGAVGQRQHVEELQRGPAPAVRLALHHGDGRRALHGEGEEDHQRQCAAERHVVVQRGLQVERLRAGISAVESAHGADHHLAREHAGEQPDADLPVEARGRNGRLDEVAEAADDALGQLRRGEHAGCRVHDRQMRQDPQRQGDAHDDGAGVPQEDARAVDQPQRQRVERGHAVLRQLQDERRVAGFEDRSSSAAAPW